MDDRRIQKTKKAIKDALISIWLEKNSLKVTVTEISLRANINRKTFYLHYDSVESVIHEFIKDQINELMLILEEKDYFNNLFDINILFQALNFSLEKHIDLYRHIANSPSQNLLSDEIINVLKNSFLENLHSKVNVPPEEFKLYVEFYASGTIAVYLKWLRNEISISEKQLSQVAENAIFYGFQQLLSSD